MRMDGLLRGKSKSCGCLRKEITKETHYKHGQRRNRIYRIWRNMKTRCLNVNSPNHERYGERQIGLCSEWMEFKNFYSWAVIGGYNDNLTIERIDVNGNYEPGNCKWIPAKEQQLNKRTSLIISYNGESKCLKEWVDILGVDYSVVYQRISKLGWSAERALSTPARKIRR